MAFFKSSVNDISRPNRWISSKFGITHPWDKEIGLSWQLFLIILFCLNPSAVSKFLLSIFIRDTFRFFISTKSVSVLRQHLWRFKECERYSKVNVSVPNSYVDCRRKWMKISHQVKLFIQLIKITTTVKSRGMAQILRCGLYL